MNQDTHTKLSELVARTVGFPEPEIVGTAAATPDQVRIAWIDGVGDEIEGRNISSLTHFRGYRWRSDASVGKINLPDRTVIYLAGKWPDMPLGSETGDPLFRLLRVDGYTKAADEMTWPGASSYAHWFFTICSRIVNTWNPCDGRPDDRRRMLAVNAGRCLHYVQDLCVPQHRRNELLARHVETENEIAKAFDSLDGDKRLALAKEHCNVPAWSPFGICRTLEARKTPRVPHFSCRRRALVKEAIVDGLRLSAAVLRYIDHDIA